MKDKDQVTRISKEILQFASQFDGALLYNTNAFRLLQLPVTATDRDITRRKQVLEIALKTDAPIPDGPCKLFPIDLAAAKLDINLLVDRLRDPINRLHDEFFWFGPVSDKKPESDPALQALSQGDLAGALSIWNNQVADPKEAAINLHNLVIFHHFSALSDLVDTQDIGHYWETAYQMCREMVTLGDLWNLLTSRVREIGDPRLTLDHVAILRKSIFSILSYTNVSRAVSLIEKDETAAAGSLISVFNNAQEDKQAALDIIRLAIAPQRERIENAVALAEKKTKSDPCHADAAAEALLSEGSKQLNVVNALLPRSDRDASTLKEKIFNTALKAIDAFFEKTDDWDRSIELVHQAQRMAISAKEKQETEKRLKVLSEFGEKKNYWCCKGYFNSKIPKALYKELEKARELFDKEEYDAAIQMLEDLVTQYSADPDLCRLAIHPPLALTLHQKANQLMIEAMKCFDAPRSLLMRIAENIHNYSRRACATLAVLASTPPDRLSRHGDLYCMCCETRVLGRFYIGEKDDLKYLVCSSCYDADRTEIESKKRKAKPFFDEGRKHLERAHTAQPENKAVSDAYEDIKKILKDIYDISIPALTPVKKTAPDVPKKPDAVPIKPSLPSASTDNINKKRERNLYIWLGVITGIVILCSILAYAGVFDDNYEYNYYQPTRAEIPKTVYKTPTKIPTSPPTHTPSPILPAEFTFPGELKPEKSYWNTDSTTIDWVEDQARYLAIPSGKYVWAITTFSGNIKLTDIKQYYVATLGEINYKFLLDEQRYDNKEMQNAYWLKMSNGRQYFFAHFWSGTENNPPKVLLFLYETGNQTTSRTSSTPLQTSQKTSPPSVLSNTQDPSILFIDDFSDDSSGWEKYYSDEDVSNYYKEGAYHIVVKDSEYYYYSVVGRYFTDTRIEVDVTKVAGPDDNLFGIICRYEDNNNYYDAYFSNDGYYSIDKFYNGESELLTGQYWSKTNRLNSGSKMNHIRFDCIGSRLSLYANGYLLDEFTDTSLRSGHVGLLAGTSSDIETHFTFDNFIVSKP